MASWIAYVGPFSFPWGQPGSRRVYGICRSLSESGYRVVVGSGQHEKDAITKLVDNNIFYRSLGDSQNPEDSTINKLMDFFFFSGNKTVRWLDSQDTLPTCVIVYGGGAAFMHKLIAWSKKTDVPIVVDVVEWYDGSHMQGGWFGPFHINSKIAMHYYYKKCNGVIAISSLLEDFYKKEDVRKVIKIPPTLDTLSFSDLHNEGYAISDQINIVYAGSPGKKDLLDCIINAMSLIDGNNRLRLTIIGPSYDEVKLLTGGKNIPDSVEVLGRLEQKDVFKKLANSDFSIILRHPIRFAHAGFPTKFVESMSCGIPVIANYTSDMSDYLTHGIEGIVVKEATVSSLVDAFHEILNLTSGDLEIMKKNAYSRACADFDYRKYSNLMRDFVEGLGK